MIRIEIKNGLVWENDQIIYQDQKSEFNDFAKGLFKKLEIDYPKFYKMDQQSKLAFLTAELLLKNENTLNEEKDIALIFANKNSSLESDLKHQKSIQTEGGIFPSPAVFVYTLANICLGEVSIRHHLKTENTFFISETFNEDLYTKYAHYLIENNRAKKVVIAWVDFLQEEYSAKMILVENNTIIE
jgi:hypothetical protein